MSVITGLLFKDQIHELTSPRVSDEAKMKIVLAFKSYFKLKIIYLIKFWFSFGKQSMGTWLSNEDFTSETVNVIAPLGED